MTNRRVIALGFFDGVHIGHGALLQEARRKAAELDCTAAALSFDVHPSVLLSGTQVPLLSTLKQRELLMRRFYGIDEVLFAHFDRKMMAVPWEQFITDTLIDQLHACWVVCGHDYRFGCRGEGTADKLKQRCDQLGIGCSVISEVALDGRAVSSTLIRQLISDGQTETAVRYLGHPHLLSGEVIRGNQLGRTIGIPTANVAFPEGILVPPAGVYCAKAEWDGEMHAAVVNIGIHPTAGSLPAPITEVWIPGFAGDLYGKDMNIWLYRMLRPERRFSSMAELQQQILRDAESVEQYFNA